MKMPEVELKRMDELYSLFDKGWNCAPAYTPEYEREHEEIHRIMKERLQQLLNGPHFSAMEDGWTESRSVGAYFETLDFLRPDLVTRLWEIVKDLPHDYMLYVFGCDFAPEMSDFNIVLTKSFIWCQVDDPKDIVRIHKAHPSAGPHCSPAAGSPSGQP